MPLRNRVTPFGELVAHPARGLVYGNRGCLHDAEGNIRRHHSVKRWISCRLEFRGWERGPMMQPGRFTELFFLDEATAFAAGHRPCAMCRHEDYAMFLARWRELHPGTRGADELDDRLHRERFDQATGTQRRYLASSDDLPDGATVAMRGDAYVIAHEQGRRWTPNGYVGQARTLDRRVEVLTPPSVIAILRDGWDGAVPLIHPSGRA